MVTVWVVEILTTDGINFSARSAKEVGASSAFATKLQLIKKIVIIKNLK